MLLRLGYNRTVVLHQYRMVKVGGFYIQLNNQIHGQSWGFYIQLNNQSQGQSWGLYIQSNSQSHIEKGPHLSLAGFEPRQR